MKWVTATVTAPVLAVLAVLATTPIRAQEANNDRTFMTFSSAVELPGVTLEPGTYEFRLADNDKQNVVQVFRKDSHDVIGQWTFVPAERPRISNDTLVMFKETREGATPAVQYWYFPNEKIGKEFIYPKSQAQQIAARTGQTVRSEDGPIAPSTSASASREPTPAAAAPEPRVTAVDANRPVEAAEAGNEPSVRAQASAQEPSPRGEPVEPAPRPVGTSGSNAQPPDAGAPSAAAAARNDDSQQVARASELPKTASPLPISGLIGLLSLAGAAGMRALRAR
jgi:hypothetical protein